MRLVEASTDDALPAEMREIEGRRREDAAREAVVLAELDRRKAHRADEHATMWGLLRSTLHWSKAGCQQRMRLARFVVEHPEASASGAERNSADKSNRPS